MVKQVLFLATEFKKITERVSRMRSKPTFFSVFSVPSVARERIFYATEYGKLIREFPERSEELNEMIEIRKGEYAQR